MSPRDTTSPTALDRRRFLRLMGLSAAAVLVPGPARALARLAGPRQRFLHLVVTHTGESSTVTYWRDGAYLPAALDRLAHLLRDHRTGDVHPIAPGLLDVLWHTAGSLDVPPRFHVISGYRSPATNAMLRRQGHAVARHSYHLLGRAADVRLEGVSMDRLAATGRALRLGGVGFYPRSGFVHLDDGPVRSW